MSFIKDINELPLAIKAFVVSLAIFFPCWYLILYSFFPAILEWKVYQVILVVFVPTLIWYLLELGTCKLFTDIFINHYGVIFTDAEFWIIPVLDGIFYLFIFSIIAFYSHISFEKYAWITFSFRFIFFIYFIVLNNYFNKKITSTNYFRETEEQLKALKESSKSNESINPT